ncbi:MAG: hypothetical protein GY856_35170 [bacterium]|nr:hypothetical protein [bacterium]
MPKTFNVSIPDGFDVKLACFNFYGRCPCHIACDDSELSYSEKMMKAVADWERQQSNNLYAKENTR